MRGCTITGWDRCTEAVERDLFIVIIVLQDPSYRADGTQVFVSRQVVAVERVILSWVSIRQSKINGNIQIDFTPSKDILQEICCSLYFETINMALLALNSQTFLPVLQLTKRSVSSS